MHTAIENFIHDASGVLRFEEPIYVTRPNLPFLAQYAETLQPAWDRKWLTNEGCLHQRLEQALTDRLDVPHLQLFCNGMAALMTALQSLNLGAGGTVITTPFTFPATVNALYWNGLRPVFCDIDPDTYNMDPNQIERLITSSTRAVLPVHVYGRPCAVEEIQGIADRHGLPVLYDAAHAFGVRYRGKSLLRWGDLSMLSFHATKLFTTGEGGALAIAEEAVNQRVRLLKNFGIANEDTVAAPGLNGKMSELHAALGLTQLGMVADEIKSRRAVAEVYHRELSDEPGLTLPPLDLESVESNYAYYPVRIISEQYGMNRDDLYEALKAFNLMARKYFYPLCSGFPWCRAAAHAVPNAEAAAKSVLCLPIYGALSPETASRIARIIRQLGALVRSSA